MTPQHSLSERAHEMFAAVERYRESELTQKQFCHSEGLALTTFQYWAARYRQYHSSPENPQAAFVELKAAQPQTQTSGQGIFLTYPNGVTLNLPPSAIDLASLKQLIILGVD